MTRKFSSISVETTLASSISNSATSMTVASGTGSALMGGVTLAAGNVDTFGIALDVDTQNEEIIYITAVSTEILENLRVIVFPYLAGVVNTDWILVCQLQSLFL